MLLGVILAFIAAIITNLGYLWKHRGAVEAPKVEIWHPLRSLINLFSSKWWAIGMLTAAGAWIIHVAALALAPLSLVQAVLSGGLVFLAVLAERWFGFSLGKRQWAGITVTAVGLAILGITQEHTDIPHSEYSLAALIAFEAGVFAMAILLLITGHMDRWWRKEGLLLGAAAGALFGVSNVAIKYLTEPVGDSVIQGLLSPWTAAALAASVVAFYASARSLQIGPGIEVITVTSITANLGAITGGILVFHDSIGNGPVEIVGRSLAFMLVIAGAALMPAPIRLGDSAQPDPTQAPPEPYMRELDPYNPPEHLTKAHQVLHMHKHAKLFGKKHINTTMRE